LDNQATTPLDPIIFSAMEPWFTEKFGNASSRNHTYGWEAEEAVEIARESVAAIIGSLPKEIIFTSGATEANNIALQGVAKNYQNQGRHIITLKTEHKAVMDVCQHLSKDGFVITYLPVDKDGMLNVNKFEDAIRDDTILASVMHVNNEIGVIQPIKELGAICKNKNVIFHVDAAQSLGEIPLNVDDMGIDLLSISAHKFYGPKGIGGLYIRRKDPRVELRPIMFGGGHERGIRSGTLPVPNIVGMGRACDLAADVMNEENLKITTLRDALLQGIRDENPKTLVNGSMEKRVAGNLNMSFPGVNNEAIIAAIPEIAISGGSACTTSTMEPSHVLLALGMSKEEAYYSLRFGIGRFNTEQDIHIAVKSINGCMKKLGKMSFV
ncbi:MAG TPA: aminotransferase class V-fold PLP-dependent enzyme, partial [Candidatus Marinimicrobia bacterium]|nr:aminotransferase class V-fold PLP-dependent enzyme [Candidatus Neomarinimicrobiota bacterium]